MIETEVNEVETKSGEVKKLLDHPISNIFNFLELFFLTKKAELVKLGLSFIEKREEDRWFGLDIFDQDLMVGELKLSFSSDKQIIIKRSWIDGEFKITSFDVFDENGSLYKNMAECGTSPTNYAAEIYDENAVADIFYRFLKSQYGAVIETSKSTKLLHNIEIFLRKIEQKKQNILSIEKGVYDQSLELFFQKNIILESDPVLRWEERQSIIKHNYDKLKEVYKLKSRVHQLGFNVMALMIFMMKLRNFATRFKIRPIDNFLGLLYKYSFGKVLWFFSTVKNNLGYSVALAVYGPFTYYFITMPMNPHAMSAVGKVRSVYLDVKENLIHRLEKVNSPEESIVVKSKAQNEKTSQKNNINLKNDNKVIAGPIQLDNNIIGISDISFSKEYMASIFFDESTPRSYRPSILNLILSTDIDQINEQSWKERMSRFKNMEIAYEENMEFASRMGRLEQMETQYNFPMMVESTWGEMERYLNDIFKIRNNNNHLSPKFKQYLVNEVNRTHQLQLYLWDRLSRFILDQPYVMLDQDKEQQRNDYYIGRSFVFMDEMTQTMNWRYKDFKKPYGYEKIEKLAKNYTEKRKEKGNILLNLKENSSLFKQEDYLSSKEFRSYMKRQWEVLYLQNAKAEEASNNGLNMYIWSVRNTVWILQSIYANRREDLQILLSKDLNGLNSENELYSLGKIESLYETLFHNMTLEYVSIKEELERSIGKDIESAQREVVINNIKEFFIDRNKMLNKNTPIENIVSN